MSEWISIEDRLQPYCVGCGDIDPIFTTKKLYGDSTVLAMVIVLKCENAERCEQLRKHFEVTL